MTNIFKRYKTCLQTRIILHTTLRINTQLYKTLQDFTQVYNILGKLYKTLQKLFKHSTQLQKNRQLLNSFRQHCNILQTKKNKLVFEALQNFRQLCTIAQNNLQDFLHDFTRLLQTQLCNTLYNF